MKKSLAAVLLAGVLCACLLSAYGSGGVSAGAENPYTITEPYVYPVAPGTDEWARFQTHEEMIQACAIPEDRVGAMTTEALLSSVAAYPLLGDMLAWDEPDRGLSAVIDSFNGLEEFCSREDALETLERYLAGNDPSGEDYRQQISAMCLGMLRDRLETVGG